MPSNVKFMGQKDQIAEILRDNGRFTKGWLAKNHRHLVYKHVQRIWDLQADGWIIRAFGNPSEDWENSGYELIATPSEPLPHEKTEHAFVNRQGQLF